jgi:hypothetical protein
MMDLGGARIEGHGRTMRIVRHNSIRTAEVLVGYLFLGLFNDAL